MISRIINNKLYCEVYEHGKRKGKNIEELRGIVPPILTETMLEQCQKSIQENMSNYHRVHDYKYMKKLVCPCCSDVNASYARRMAGHSTKKRHGENYLYYIYPECRRYINDKDIDELSMYYLDDSFQFHKIMEIHTSCFQLDISDIDSKAIQSEINFTITYAKSSDYYNNIENLEYFKLSTEERRKFVDKYLDTIELSIEQYNNLQMKNLKYKAHMIEILDLLKNNNVIGEIKEERFERSIHQVLTQVEFDSLLEKLKNIFNVYIEDDPIFHHLTIH